jgi:hypothetical protein
MQEEVTRSTSTEEQLLGEIETEIVGFQHHDAMVQPGEQVHFEREPDNIHDTSAIWVKDASSRPVGYVPRNVAAWLASLIDNGIIRLDGYVPRAGDGESRKSDRACPLRIATFLTPRGHGLLEEREARTCQEAWHQIVRNVHRAVQNYSDPTLVLEIAAGLRPLEQRDLLPETRLLLALLPGIARELRTVRGVDSIVKLRSIMADLMIGDPLHHDNITLFPLLWPHPADPPYLLLQQAIEAGEAVVEEISGAGSVPNLLLHNKGQRPVLICEGDILMGAKQNRVVNLSVLVAARTKFTLPVSCVEQGRWRYRLPSLSRHCLTKRCCSPVSADIRSRRSRSCRRSRMSTSNTLDGSVANSPAGSVASPWTAIRRSKVA